MFISSHALPSDQFVFEVLKIGIIQVEPTLQGAIRQAPATPKHLDGLIEYVVKRHTPPSNCASFASVSGNQTLFSGNVNDGTALLVAKPSRITDVKKNALQRNPEVIRFPPHPDPLPQDGGEGDPRTEWP